MIVRLVLLCAIVFFTPLTEAKSFSTLEKLLNSYVKSNGIKIFLLKKETQKLLGTKSAHKAYLYIKHKRIRLTYLKPAKAEIIFNKKDLWIINKRAIKHTNKKALWSQIPLIQLFSFNLDLKNYFFIRWSENKFNVRVYTLKARLPSLRNKIKDFRIIINTKEKKIIKISYKDDIENLTEYQFLKTTFKQKIKDSFFNFRPKKSAKVIRL
ncbi:MAG: hypothetical protein HAW63_00945 [Bdellovibrionaceae bacterium]|nr:hypothetical protein [Pseudobdellovibrionaceae bacterium]